MKVAKERKSSVLASNAIHHRVDSLTSIVALVAIGGSHLIEGATWLDPVGGLLVSAMVVQAGLGNTKAAVLELCDRGLDEEVVESITRAAQKADVGGEVEIKEVQGVKAGQNYLVEIEVAAPKAWNLERLRVVEDALRDRIGSKVRGVRRVRVRFVPKEQEKSDFLHEFIAPDVSPRSSPEPEPTDETGHAHEHHDHWKASGVSKKPSSAAKRH